MLKENIFKISSSPSRLMQHYFQQEKSLLLWFQTQISSTNTLYSQNTSHGEPDRTTQNVTFTKIFFQD